MFVVNPARVVLGVEDANFAWPPSILVADSNKERYEALPYWEPAAQAVRMYVCICFELLLFIILSVIKLMLPSINFACRLLNCNASAKDDMYRHPSRVGPAFFYFVFLKTYTSNLGATSIT
jgi:hypothetical protein